MSEQPAVQRKGSVWRTIKAVAWSFIGLRKGADYQQDIEKLNPLHILAVGIVAGFLFVAVLIAIVKAVV
ncbi:MAG: DUF2970 domain-containing protein [Acidovorax sp.]